MEKRGFNSIISVFETYWFFSLLIAVLIAGFILYISSIPSYGFPTGLGLLPKVYHLVIFALLAFFLSLAIIRKQINNKYLIIIVLLLSIAYAISDELHQSFVPGRHCAIKDVFIDTTGILISIIFYYALRE
jgi:hypothetical protein